jgi:D-alanyl-D-alanine dipeptidase
MKRHLPLLVFVLLALAACASGSRSTYQALDSTGVFRVNPARPVAELLPLALASTPPSESGDFRPADLVELTALDPTIKLDIRYATTRNFLGTPLYSQARAFMQRPAAEALVRVQRSLKAEGYGLLVHDAYRPWYVTKIFWDAMPAELHKFVADPAEGSRHNRGCAVDLTLYELETGKPVSMVSGYDEMSDLRPENRARGKHAESVRRGNGAGVCKLHRRNGRAAPLTRPAAAAHGSRGLFGL